MAACCWHSRSFDGLYSVLEELEKAVNSEKPGGAPEKTGSKEWQPPKSIYRLGQGGEKLQETEEIVPQHSRGDGQKDTSTIHEDRLWEVTRLIHRIAYVHWYCSKTGAGKPMQPGDSTGCFAAPYD